MPTGPGSQQPTVLWGICLCFLRAEAAQGAGTVSLALWPHKGPSGHDGHGSLIPYLDSRESVWGIKTRSARDLGD